MPDWQEVVRRRLSGLVLDSGEKEDVQSELAAHLEDAHECFLKEGMGESEATERTFSLAKDWQDLQRRIHSVRNGRGTMNNRVTQLWLPGLLTFALSMVLLEVAQKFGPRPFILDLDKGMPVLMFYTPWLLALPLAGALGAYLSWRAGGSARTALVSSVFPVLPYGVVFMLAIPVGLVISRSLAHNIVAAAFVTMTIGWVLVPGIALLAGGLLVQLLRSWRSGSHGVSMI